MSKNFDLGHFDLDIQLWDEALDERNSPARRMVANASIGIAPFDAYYSTRELREAIEGVHEGRIGAKQRLARILGTECDDYQRCLYYQLAGRGVVQMMDVLAWLEDLLAKRTIISAELSRSERRPAVMMNPYDAAEPDGPLVSAGPNFEEGDPDLGGVIDE